jgi:hypothetical protein
MNAKCFRNYKSTVLQQEQKRQNSRRDVNSRRGGSNSRDTNQDSRDINNSGDIIRSRSVSKSGTQGTLLAAITSATAPSPSPVAKVSKTTIRVNLPVYSLCDA